MTDAMQYLLQTPLTAELIFGVATSMAFVHGFVSGINTH